jgi:hypothetical protein
MWRKAFVVVAAAVTVAGCGPDRSSPSVVGVSPTVVVATSAPPTSAPTSAPAVVQTLPTQASPAPAVTAPAPPVTAPEPAATGNDTSGAGNNGGGSGSCGQDYYRNSDGVCVHRPASGPGAPAGATARCNDGTYSYSTHRSGTCSHHGGVAVWY